MASFHLAKAQDKQYQEIEELNQSAHDRYMARARRGIEANPNSVSPWEKKNILDYHRKQQETSDLRAHELEMLQQQGKNELDVAEQKKLGMIGQGSEAAKANANATVEAAKIDSETKKYGFDMQSIIEDRHDRTKLTEAEKRMESEKGIADAKNETEKSIAERKSETEKAIAQINQQTALAQQAMDKYKVDAATAREVAKIEAQKAGKSKEDRITIIKQAQSNGQIDVNTAMKMIEEIEKEGSAETSSPGLDRWKR